MKKQSSKHSQKRRLKWWLLYLPAAFIAILTGWLIWGNRTLEVTTLTVPVKGLPSSFEGLKIAHVSDLHARRLGEAQKDLLDAVANAKPDLIAVTGDLVNFDTDDLSSVKEFVDGAVKIAPVYYITGNHEAENPILTELKIYLEQAGVVLLFDCAETLTRNGETLTLMGLTDVNMPDVECEEEMLRRLELLSKENEGCRILLSHRPELLESVYAGRAELVLTGHAHGGQVRFWPIDGLYAPGQGLFPKYTAGLYTQGGTQMIVSRGLGGPEPRVNNRPELLILTLTVKSES